MTNDERVHLSTGRFMVLSDYGIRFDQTQFWVRHRRREYGPFDYEWNKDFGGIELMYRGDKFGELCSSEEMFADLKPCGLPLSVAQVTSIVWGCLFFGLLQGYSEAERRDLLAQQLVRFGFDRFLQFQE